VLEDGGPLGTVHQPLTVVVQPGEHCMRVTPPAGATGTLSVQATFFDICGLGPRDDHGDSFLCATRIGVGESRTGEISPADQDVFSFTLATGAAATISVTGTLDAEARGTRSLDAGSYFVRIEGQDGPGGTYEIALSASPL
jgi:hypothetical protein